jgi:hypothetical protein
MQKKLKILGIACITFGLLAALLPFLPYGLFLSIPVGFIGMLCSTAYVYLDTKNGVNTKKFTIGVWSMLLSSVPILMILGLIIMKKMNG